MSQKTNPVNADRLLDRLDEAANLIAETPGMGVKRPNLAITTQFFDDFRPLFTLVNLSINLDTYLSLNKARR